MLVVRVLITVVMLIGLVGESRAEERGGQTAIPATTKQFFSQHCISCHGTDLSEGNLNLQTIQADMSDSETAQKWIEILDRINLGEMPPVDEPRPPATELTAVVDWITNQTRQQYAAISSTGGKVVMRRMTRLEYARTVSDLFALQFVDGQGPHTKLPPDGAIKGFDRHAKALMVDPSLLDAYLLVANDVANQAVRFRPPRIQQKTMRFDFRHTKDSAMRYIIEGRAASIGDRGMVLMDGAARTFGMLKHPFDGREIPADGLYRVRIRAGAERGAPDKDIFMRVRQGAGETIAQFKVGASPDQMQVFETTVTRSSQLQGEFEVAIVGGTQFSSYVPFRGDQSRAADEAFREGDIARSLRIKARMRAQGDRDTGIRNRYKREVLDLEGLPKLYLDWIEVTGPLQEEFPPASMQIMFPEGWSGIDPLTNVPAQRERSIELADQAIGRLLARAFRRLPTKLEQRQILELVELELDRGSTFAEAFKSGIVAMLCSPNFLFLHESSQGDSQASAPLVERSDNLLARPLTGFELATRLSYFLWSSKPDDELMRTAAQGTLLKSEILQEQVNRMIDSPKIDGFVEGFVRQWLRVDEFNRFEPDERVFPRYHEARFSGIEKDFERQPLEMVRVILGSDLPVTDLIDSDWTMLSPRLAEFYGVAGASKEGFSRVNLNERDATMRGGLLGMAGVHRLGSDGSRTKPVDRGKYILDVFFNDPPPPPPPNAGEVEPNLHGQKLTIRQRLAKHREQTTCNNCHRRIDPYGLAMENFNTIGLWREREDGERPLERWGDDRPAIDSSGQLMTGARFDNFVEFKSRMFDQRQRFARGLTEKLVSYALARSIEPADRVLIDAIVQRCQESNYSLRTILSLIVQSKTFRSK